MDRYWLIGNLIPAMWIVWALYWLICAHNAKRTVRRESLASRFSHVAPLVVGALLVALPQVPSVSKNGSHPSRRAHSSPSATHPIPCICGTG